MPACQSFNTDTDNSSNNNTNENNHTSGVAAIHCCIAKHLNSMQPKAINILLYHPISGVINSDRAWLGDSSVAGGIMEVLGPWWHSPSGWVLIWRGYDIWHRVRWQGSWRAGLSWTRDQSAAHSLSQGTSLTDSSGLQVQMSP